MPNDVSEWVEALCVPDTHPSLPGHFPGQPVVAGVILLDLFAAHLERAGFGALQHLSAVKFRSPLMPGQIAEMRIRVDGNQVRFRVMRDDELLTSGEGELA